MLPYKAMSFFGFLLLFTYLYLAILDLLFGGVCQCVVELQTLLMYTAKSGELSKKL